MKAVQGAVRLQVLGQVRAQVVPEHLLSRFPGGDQKGQGGGLVGFLAEAAPQGMQGIPVGLGERVAFGHHHWNP